MTKGMIKIDFHVHTTSSLDSTIKVQELAKKAGMLGIIPAITDHSSMGAIAKFRETGVPFIPGEEIRTERGDLIGIYLSEEIKPYTPFADALDIIKEQGGLSCLPHMYDITRKGCGDFEPAEKADIVEGFNARCILDGYNQSAIDFAKKHGKPIVAGSDAHFILEFGRTYTLLPEFDIEDPKALLRALKSGMVELVGRKAPFYVHGPTNIVGIGRRIKAAIGMEKDIK